MAWPLAAGISARRQASELAASMAPGRLHVGVQQSGARRSGELTEGQPHRAVDGQRLHHELGAPGDLGVGQPDVEIDAEGLGDVGADEGTRCLAGHPPDHLAHEVPEHHGLVARGGPRLPPRLLGGEQAGDAVPVVEVLALDRLARSAEPGPVAEQPPHRDRLLAGRGELRPVLGDGPVDVDEAPVDELLHGHRHRTLGGRPHVDERVVLPRLGPGGVGPAAPQVDHRSPGDEDAQAGTDVAPLVEVGLEGGADRAEALVAGPLDRYRLPCGIPLAGGGYGRR